MTNPLARFRRTFFFNRLFARPLILATMGLAGSCALSGCSGPSSAPTKAVLEFDRRIVAADAEPQNWLSTGRDYQETRFSPLAEINEGNAARMGLVWSYDLDTSNGQESTPLIVDGVVFTTSAWSKVQAFDAVTGKLIWQFDPKVPGDTASKTCCDVVNRGAAFWDGKVYVGTLDGRLIAIDAKTGQQVWSVVTVDQSKPYTITGAPRIMKGKVIIGNGGAELGVRGYVTAYDAETGKRLWRFYTVPGQPGKKDGEISDKPLAQLAEKSWSGNWWQDASGNGGGTVWDSMAYDPELDLLYIGVGNGSFWNKAIRSPGKGDNLFVGSIVALKPDTGEYVWHYQQTPGDEWDYTATQHMILADLKIGGKPRKTLMQAPKNGFFYVIDRSTGKVISAEPFVKVQWAKRIDLKTGRPEINPEARYSETGKSWSTMPGPFGAHSWNPMSFSKQTGLVYIPVQEIGSTYKSDPKFKRLPVGLNLGIDPATADIPDRAAEIKAIKASLKGYLLAWDPVRQKEVWRVSHPAPWNGGVVSTAGNLVFQGDVDGFFHAMDARTGKKLWSFDAGSAVIAAPVVYAVKGKQYVTVLAGWGGAASKATGKLGWDASGARINKSRVLTFALDGKATLPARTVSARPIFAPPTQFGDAGQIAIGQNLYNRTCVHCHGPNAASAGGTPDLRYSGTLSDADTWQAVVYDGALSDRGMVAFKGNFSQEQVDSIRAYVISKSLQISKK